MVRMGLCQMVVMVWGWSCAIQALSTELMEVALWITMAALPVQQVSVEGGSLVVRVVRGVGMELCHPGLGHRADGGGPLDQDGRAARATGECRGGGVIGGEGGEGCGDGVMPSRR